MWGRALNSVTIQNFFSIRFYIFLVLVYWEKNEFRGVTGYIWQCKQEQAWIDTCPNFWFWKHGMLLPDTTYGALIYSDEYCSFNIQWDVGILDGYHHHIAAIKNATQLDASAAIAALASIKGLFSSIWTLSSLRWKSRPWSAAAPSAIYPACRAGSGRRHKLLFPLKIPFVIGLLQVEGEGRESCHVLRI